MQRVFDVTAGKPLARVADFPSPREYTLSGGVFTFSPAIGAQGKRKGHTIQITYDAAGPRVTRAHAKRRA